MLDAFSLVWVDVLLLSFFGVMLLWPFLLFYVIRSILRDLHRTADAVERIANAQCAAIASRPGGAVEKPPREPGQMPLSAFGR
jgi:hypothetical protein